MPTPRTGYDLRTLRERIKPVRLHWYPTLASTSDQAGVLRRRRSLYSPAVVLAGRQTAGRGRGRNTWWSSPGCITATFAFPPDPTVESHQLPLVAGLAVRAAAAELIGDDDLIQLKWPNDLLVDGRKLAGLLCERIDGADLVGVGLNVSPKLSSAPAGLRGRMTSLREITGKAQDLTEAMVVLTTHLHRWIGRRGERPFAAMLREYDRHHALMNANVTVTIDAAAVVSGRCEGLDSDGRLLVRDGVRLHRIISGHVESIG